MIRKCKSKLIIKLCFCLAHTLPAADPPPQGTASHPPGHPDALPLSNSPRKENQFVDSPGKWSYQHFTSYLAHLAYMPSLCSKALSVVVIVVSISHVLKSIWQMNSVP